MYNPACLNGTQTQLSNCKEAVNDTEWIVSAFQCSHLPIFNYTYFRLKPTCIGV